MSPIKQLRHMSPGEWFTFRYHGRTYLCERLEKRTFVVRNRHNGGTRIRASNNLKEDETYPAHALEGVVGLKMIDAERAVVISMMLKLDDTLNLQELIDGEQA